MIVPIPSSLHINVPSGKWQQVLPTEDTIVITENKLLNQEWTALKHPHIIAIQGGEQQKNIEMVTYIVQKLLSLRATRQSMLLAVGGGALLDLVGFSASVFLRGIPFALMPTTLLAMVDASIGGKNGINLGTYKNVIGRIEQPSDIFFCPDFLNSLPKEEWCYGMSEVIKYGCIANIAILDHLRSNSLAYYMRNREGLFTHLVKPCIAIKCDIVSKDATEKQRIRYFLNFGHTFGHAVELSNNISHGQAVAYGMVFGLWLSVRLLGFPIEKMHDVINLLKQYKLLNYQRFDTNTVIFHMQKDKKRQGNDIQCVLLEDFEKPSVVPILVKDLQRHLDVFLAEAEALYMKV